MKQEIFLHTQNGDNVDVGFSAPFNLNRQVQPYVMLIFVEAGTQSCKSDFFGLTVGPYGLRRLGP